MKLRDFSGPGAGIPCVFPFKFDNVTAYGCVLWGDNKVTISFLFCIHHNNLTFSHGALQR